MFKLNNYIKNAFIARCENQMSHDGMITINVKANVDEEQIRSDCEELIAMLKNLRIFLESNYSIAVMEDKILLTIED